ncbi:DNA-formamidopyrimidine glycosylase [Microgenomates group bacterium RBG_16_45_19]|nr:MAG: DNA-formamidopyrimidine glycosylase [Microgenomates group bacterium RBG_16_45_19]
MPELPEVETIARQLQQVLPGRKIKSVQVLREKSFVGESEILVGRKIRRVTRKAKMVAVELDREDLVLLIHLKMTGQLIFQDKGRRVVGGHPTEDWVNSLPSKHTRVIIGFTDGPASPAGRSKLFFNDMRVFGWIKIATSDEWLATGRTLPPDVIDPEFTVGYLKGVLKRSTRPVKLVLLDQAKIGGLGNIYVNDALYLTQTKPTRKANSLKPAEIKRLHQTCVQVIKRGIEAGGASENTYKHINGLGGQYQEEFLVYKREGQRCGLNGCDGVIKKIKVGGRGTYFCSRHQR